MLFYTLNENEELGAIAVAGQMPMAVTALAAIVARLTALRSDHFSCEPETVTWVDVGNTGELPQGTT